MIEQASLIIGDGNWAVKSDSLLGYALPQGKYVPREMTFTRATTGTRVNAAGLVEIVPYNLFSYSEDFTNAAWLTTDVITVNTTTAPNGTLTADTLTIPSTTNSQYYLIRNSFFINVGQYTQSFYVKKNTYGYIALVSTINGSVQTSYFDINTGVVGTTTSGTTSSITDVGNGWYRVSQTATETTGANRVIGIYFANSLMNSINVSLSLTDSFYAWGAQLVEGTQPLTYLPTTDRLDIPRIDYSTGSSALLLEPQRTNLCSNNLGFSVFGGCTIASETTNSPFGNTSDVFKVTSLGAGGVRANENVSFTSGNTYSCGHFIKFVTAITLNFSASAGHFANNGNFIFDASGNPSKTGDVNYIAYSNGWYYVYIKADVTSTVSARVNIAPSSGSFLIFKSQYELGPCATSYIPTTSTSVTRNADAFTRTNFQASGLLTATKNTFFFDINAIGATGSNYHFFKFTATSGFDISVWRFVGNQNWNIQLNGVFIDTGVSNGKFAVVQDGSQTKFFINGVLNTTTGATGTINSIDSFIGLYQLASPSFIKALAIYPEVLTDAECIALTTP
jgi:hypothetical protein